MQSIIVTLLLFSKYASSQSPDPPHWDYDHMGEWGEDFPMCDTQDESPINIDTITEGEVITDKTVCTERFDWDIDYTKHTFKIANNGHALILTPAEQVKDPEDVDWTEEDEFGNHYRLLTQNDTTIGTFPNYLMPHPDVFKGDHDTFCLHGMHFHWGLTGDTGSEHTVNGYHHPLEIHFVHYSCNYANIGTTLQRWPNESVITDAIEDGWDTNELGVVGIFYDVGCVDNPAFDNMFDDIHLEHILLPPPANSPGAQHAEIVQNLDLKDLIPCNLATGGYYAYEGSLTTPPCTDIVRWFVMRERSYISHQQLDRLRRLMSTEDRTLAPNYREVQAQNENDVFACKECRKHKTTTIY